jgi:REP element-mobilizing transposase RayT
MDYRYGSHTVYQIEYHFVWVTKGNVPFVVEPCRMTAPHS